MSMQTGRPGGTRPGFPSMTLEYPMSLGTFDKYEDAQRAVDALSDRQFPVQDCLIVGTELKQLERVTGRLTWGRVMLAGFMSGMWLGLFVGLIFAMFGGSRSDIIASMLITALAGAIFGTIWSMMGYAFTRGARDFTSVSQIVATKYEVLVEHKHAQQGREMLIDAGVLPGYATATAASTTAAVRPVDPSQLPPPPADPSSLS